MESFLFTAPALFFLFLPVILKYFLYKWLRSNFKMKRFIRSFFRWYGSFEIDMSYDNLKKQKYMGFSNMLNIPVWLAIAFMLIKLCSLLSVLAE